MNNYPLWEKYDQDKWNNLEKLKTFYTKILGFEIIGSFENHNDYGGVFIGKLNENWHLEFTQTTEIVNHTFDEDDILVFYPNSKELLVHEYQFMMSKVASQQTFEKTIKFLNRPRTVRSASRLSKISC